MAATFLILPIVIIRYTCSVSVPLISNSLMEFGCSCKEMESLHMNAVDCAIDIEWNQHCSEVFGSMDINYFLRKDQCKFLFISNCSFHGISVIL